MPSSTSSEDDIRQTVLRSRKKRKHEAEGCKTRRRSKKRARMSFSPCVTIPKPKRQRIFDDSSSDDSDEASVRLERKRMHKESSTETTPKHEVCPTSSKGGKCHIAELPQEVMLKIFRYLPLGLLIHTIPEVCRKWEALAMDWTLWKNVKDLTIRNMVIGTGKLKALLRTIPNLKKLELILRNDTEELLDELFEANKNLEFLKLDRCYRSTLQMNILSQTVTSILEFCPNLKTVILTDTYFHSKNFYKSLAKKFKTIERINVTCTTKSEMNVFMENVIDTVPEVEFQRVPMMGRADGKQIYWGPILGLVVRPMPTSPFHQQDMNDPYPNYVF